MIYPGLQFGSGYLLASPQSTSGNPAPNPTPLQVGALQNIKVTISGDIKTLYAQSQWALDSAVGKRSIKGSFEFASISNELLSQLFFGDGVTTGSVLTALSEAGTIPAVSTYTITVTHSATFATDFGVTYANTSVPFTRVASGPTQGQYSVSAGVYTFAAADASAPVLINYTYTSTTLGTTLTTSNHPMGYGPVMALNCVFPYEGGGIGFYFPNVRLGKLDLSTKQEDYAMIQTDFEAFAGAGTTPFISYAAF